MIQERDWWEKSEIIARIASAIVLPIVLLVINNTLSTTAANREKAERALQESRQRADSQANRLPIFIDFLSSDSPKKRILAEKVVRYLGTTNQIPGDVIPLLIEIDKTQSGNDAKAPDSARAALQAIASANPGLQRAIASSLPTDLYIQVARVDQIAMAKQLKANLVGEGFRVPDVEVVGELKSPRTAVEIRSFDERSLEKAQAVDRVLASMGIKATQRSLKGFGKLNHLEVWFPRD